MTGTDTETSKRGGPRACFYVDADNLIKRIKGQPDDVQSLANVKTEIAKRLEVEGYIILHSRGFSHDDIVSGKALPERALPGTKEAKAPKAAKIAREPNAKLRSIATVKGREFGSQQRAVGEKETRKENYDRGLIWAKALSSEQVAALMKHQLVKIVHAELTGVDAPLDDLLNGAGSADQTETDDAVDATDVTEPATATAESEQHAQAAN